MAVLPANAASQHGRQRHRQKYTDRETKTQTQTHTSELCSLPYAHSCTCRTAHATPKGGETDRETERVKAIQRAKENERETYRCRERDAQIRRYTQRKRYRV